jgi:predicted RNase H-like nuclease (RuvC/YqgF family)
MEKEVPEDKNSNYLGYESDSDDDQDSAEAKCKEQLHNVEHHIVKLENELRQLREKKRRLNDELDEMWAKDSYSPSSPCYSPAAKD